MSVADHFDHKPDAGFVRSYDARSARRQFQISLILILVLATAALILGVLARLDHATPQAHAGAHKLNFIHFAETLLDIRS